MVYEGGRGVEKVKKLSTWFMNNNARHQLFASPRIEITNSVQVVCISKISFNTHDK